MPYIMKVMVANSDRVYYLADLFLTLSQNKHDAVIFESEKALDMQMGRVEQYLEGLDENITAQCDAVEWPAMKTFFS